MARVRSNRVSFTVNNYEASDLETIEKYIEANETRIQYMVCGLEEGANGTPHIQGFVHLKEDPKKCGIKFWKNELKWSQPAHYENARGTDEQNYMYCSKDGPFITAGEPGSPGDRYKAIYEKAQDNLQEAIAMDYEFGIRNYNALKAIHEESQGQRRLNITGEPKDWQTVALDKLNRQDDRKILFVVDEEGGKGKSWLAKWMMMKMDNVWACQGIYFYFWLT